VSGAPDLGALVAAMPHAAALGVALESASADEVVGGFDWAEERCTAGSRDSASFRRGSKPGGFINRTMTGPTAWSRRPRHNAATALNSARSTSCMAAGTLRPPQQATFRPTPATHAQNENDGMRRRFLPDWDSSLRN